jgi:hypothetical protein
VVEPIAYQTESLLSDPEDTRAQALSLLQKPSIKSQNWLYGCIPRYLSEGAVELAAYNQICPNKGLFPSAIISLDCALEGISQKQVLRVCATPEDFLALVFFLGGKAHFNAHWRKGCTGFSSSQQQEW